MALLQSPSLCFPLVLLFSLLITSSHCFSPKSLNISKIWSNNGWSTAGATWYGSPSGAGSDGGACGYGTSVGRSPFSSMVSAGGPSLFKSGKGCGACYQVKCTGNAACSGNPVTVVITDNCPGGPCVATSTHFDLSGKAFGAMAHSGRANELRNVGVLQIQYQRVECNHPREKVTFQVDSGSSPYYFATLIMHQNGDGDLSAVNLKQANSKSWLPMQQSWGAIWKLDGAGELHAPFSIKLTSLKSGKTLVADNVIPAGWQPGRTYQSRVNF